MNRLTKITVVALSLLVFSYAALGYVLNKQDDEKSYRSLTVYGEVLQRIQEEYVEEPNMTKVTAGALHGLLESLDPNSSYLSPQEYTEYKKQLASRQPGQVGVTLSKRSGYVIVVSVLPNSPAEAAGIRTGDFLESISGFATREMSAAQASNLLAGSVGSQVKVSVIRRGRGDLGTDEVTITRGQVSYPHIAVTKLAPDTAYMRVESLDKGKADEIRSKLADLDKDGVKKLVLDLRGCAAGDETEGVSVAKLFLASGKIASLKGQTVSAEDFNADPKQQAWKNSVAVLTSGATSGAAEIVAAAIGGNKRGDVVGERTFGSASHQKLIEFDDGSAVILTDSIYYTPGGKSILEDGVTPTTEQAQTTDDPAAFSKAENPPMTPAAAADDPVLSKALDLLNNSAKKVAVRRPVAPMRRSMLLDPTLG
jgi:carboxyl-terminal processing protease